MKRFSTELIEWGPARLAVVICSVVFSLVAIVFPLGGGVPGHDFSVEVVPYLVTTHDPETELPTVVLQMPPGPEAVKSELPPVLPTVVSTTQMVATTTPQFVVLAFDGSGSLPMWEKTRAFAREETAKGTPVKFTYFISSVFLLEEKNKLLYHPPKPERTGMSKIGFGYNRNDVAARIAEINGAFAEGNEIGSHLNGHAESGAWTAEDWKNEFATFSQFVFHVSENNQWDPAFAKDHALALTAKDIVGFRTPNLAVNKDLWGTLKENGYRYDTSLTGRGDQWPVKRSDGMWEFPVMSIAHAASSTHRILAMDYNFYYNQSGAKDIAKKGTPEWQVFYQDMLDSYRQYFQKNYAGNRAPVFIGHHFSEWNDGAYWEAMKTFASETCGRPGVQCVTYRELADWLDAHR